MSLLKLGVIRTSKKEDERRVPIHPEHLKRLAEPIRRQLIFEKGYGLPFNFEDKEISDLTGGIATRNELLSDIGAVIIAKPMLSDLEELKYGGTIWGYPHCAQQMQITKTAIDKKLKICMSGIPMAKWEDILFTKIMKWRGIAQ